MTPPALPPSLDLLLDPLTLLTALAALCAGGAVLAVAYGGYAYAGEVRLRARLERFVAGSGFPLANASATRPSLRSRLAPTLTWVAGRMGDLLPARSTERMRANLASAGLAGRTDLTNFLAAKAALAVVLGVPWLFLIADEGMSAAQGVLVAGMFGVVGFYLPGVWLGRRITARRQAVSRALPDALDLLSISVSAGLGFDGALLEVVQRLHNPLTEELAAVQRDMRLGQPRRDALRALTERTGVPDVSGLVAVVVQADELGTPLRDALRVQSEQLRQQRRQKAEERARQATIKMLIPMVLFIFPAIFIVLLGPAVPSFDALMAGG